MCPIFKVLYSWWSVRSLILRESFWFLDLVQCGLNMFMNCVFHTERLHQEVIAIFWKAEQQKAFLERSTNSDLKYRYIILALFTLMCLRCNEQAIRTLVSKCAGSNSYAGYMLGLVCKDCLTCWLLEPKWDVLFLGPTKLFLLVKAPASFSQPVHFLPKRDFRYNKKVTKHTDTMAVAK